MVFNDAAISQCSSTGNSRTWQLAVLRAGLGSGGFSSSSSLEPLGQLIQVRSDLLGRGLSLF